MLFLHVLDKVICTWKVLLAALTQVALPTVHHNTVTFEAVPRGILTGIKLLAAEITLENLRLAVNLKVVFEEQPLVENCVTFRAFCLDILLGARLIVTSG